MIHRFVDLTAEPVVPPDVIYMVRRHTGGTTRTFALAGGTLAAPAERLSLPATGAGTATLSQPLLSPDKSEYVYLRRDDNLPVTNEEIRRGDTADIVSPVTILNVSPPPFSTIDIIGWSPDGQQIYYRGENDTTDRDTEIRVMDRDGSNNTLLWSSPTDTTLQSYMWGQRAQISPDGTQIALWVDESSDGGLWVMDSDGTNMTRIYTATTASFPRDFYGWSPDGNWLLFTDLAAGHEYIYKCDPTGANLTTLYDRLIGTDPSILLAIGPSWLSDSSGVAARKDLGGAEPQHEIGVLSADGSETWTALSPQRKAYEVMTGLVYHYGPVVFGQRIYWTEGVSDGGEKIVSALYDGSDYRVDHDMDTDATEDDWSMNGFWGTAI